MLVEGIITLIIVAALFYVAPSVLNSVREAAPRVVTARIDVGNLSGGGGILGDAALNASQTTIGTTVVGALNLSTVGVIMLGIGIMIGGFMLIRSRQ